MNKVIKFVNRHRRFKILNLSNLKHTLEYIKKFPNDYNSISATILIKIQCRQSIKLKAYSVHENPDVIISDLKTYLK